MHNRPVVICKDAFSGRTFRTFKELHQSSAGTDLTDKTYTYEDVLYVLQQKEKLENSDFSDFKSKFWLMFLFDAILGNRDRHEGNWFFFQNSVLNFGIINIEKSLNKAMKLSGGEKNDLH